MAVRLKPKKSQITNYLFKVSKFRDIRFEQKMQELKIDY